MRSGIAAVLVGTLVLMSGCSSWSTKAAGDEPGTSGVLPDELIARDFARAIVQIPVLAPATTTVRFDPQAGMDNRFLHALQDSLRQAGFAIRISGDPGLANRVSHTENREVEPGNSTFSTHEVAVGTVRFRRQYRIDDAARVSPASALFVKGADASALVMDDSLFYASQAPIEGSMRDDEPASRSDRGRRDSGATRGSRRVDPSRSRAVVSAIPPKQALPRLPLAASVSAPLISQAQAGSRANVSPRMANGFPALGSSGTERTDRRLLPYTRNVFDTGRSNFGDLLGGYRNIDERILVFGNDSMRLGNENKVIIESMMKEFDARTDVMSLVGCSLGPTKIRNGNQTLALGRANRVKETLVLAGVPQDRILDEGCWAGESDRKMPSRGVVITHRRERG